MPGRAEDMPPSDMLSNWSSADVLTFALLLACTASLAVAFREQQMMIWFGYLEFAIVQQCAFFAFTQILGAKDVHERSNSQMLLAAVVYPLTLYAAGAMAWKSRSGGMWGQFWLGGVLHAILVIPINLQVPSLNALSWRNELYVVGDCTKPGAVGNIVWGPLCTGAAATLAAGFVRNQAAGPVRSFFYFAGAAIATIATASPFMFLCVDIISWASEFYLSSDQGVQAIGAAEWQRFLALGWAATWEERWLGFLRPAFFLPMDPTIPILHEFFLHIVVLAFLVGVAWTLTRPQADWDRDYPNLTVEAPVVIIVVYHLLLMYFDGCCPALSTCAIIVPSIAVVFKVGFDNLPG
eukprot:TRINITY_DN7070_c0_g1_i1.p1 TRINITY_DN7070_c0_g1~~TRINITY_DN7070_c0_g1_i1.p1  ORF type:complete len:386 (+),score=86.85 TRINITY_DN7070_c0_g1_i1:107-1159(+)